MGSSREVTCSKCGNKAVTQIKYAKLNLCKDHFLDYILNRIEKSIVKYDMIKPGSKILAAVSGGKDSSTMLLTLSKLKSKLKFDLIALHIDLGISEYSNETKSFAEKVCKMSDTRYTIIKLEDLIGLNISNLSRKLHRPPCSVCGAIKRYLLNLAGVEANVEAVALGHHLDDLTTYIIKNFLLQKLEDIRKLGPKTESHHKFLVSRIRPLCEVYEKEIALYAIFTGIPYQTVECPHRSMGIEDKIKAFLNNIEEDSPGFKIAFLRSIAKNTSKYPLTNSKVRQCEICGMPSQSNICSFCKMMHKALGKSIGLEVRNRVKESILKIIE